MNFISLTFNLFEEYQVQQFVAGAIRNKQILSAHDISEGGLIVTLIEKGFNRNLGFAVEASVSSRNDAFWLGEAQSRVVVTCSAEQLAELQGDAMEKGIGCTVIGKVTDGAIAVNGADWGNIAAWKNLYDTAIENIINKS